MGHRLRCHCLGETKAIVFDLVEAYRLRDAPVTAAWREQKFLTPVVKPPL